MWSRSLNQLNIRVPYSLGHSFSGFPMYGKGRTLVGLLMKSHRSCGSHPSHA